MGPGQQRDLLDRVAKLEQRVFDLEARLKTPEAPDADDKPSETPTETVEAAS